MPDALQRDPYTWGTGRRKTSVARVRIKPGQGKILVNEREFKQYFQTYNNRPHAIEPLQATKMETKWDVWIDVQGGGPMSQAGAVRLGIARALMKADPSLERQLRREGFLRRDPRKKERKKYGRRGARRATQYSKR
jgi:small subunit ribosomal protein S9